MAALHPRIVYRAQRLEQDRLMAVVVLDQRLLDLVDEDVEVEKIAGGCVFTEGPVWHSRERHLTFSDIYDVHGGTLYRWTRDGGQQVFRRPSGHANGNTYDNAGNLITCHHERYVSITSPDGKVSTLVDHFGDARLNSPNDVICAPNGDLLFTDPVYGLRQPDGSIVDQEYPFSGVFLYSRENGAVVSLASDIPSPNGLALTADGRTLYVCNTGGQTVHAFNVMSEGRVGDHRVVCNLNLEGHQGRPDGMKLDSLGNIYVAGNSQEGIWVFAPDGTLLGFIGVGEETNRQGTAPGGPANLAWGDDDWQTIYATAVTSVYRLRMKVPGQPVRID
jgi:gluconolactonase